MPYQTHIFCQNKNTRADVFITAQAERVFICRTRAISLSLSFWTIPMFQNCFGSRAVGSYWWAHKQCRCAASIFLISVNFLCQAANMHFLRTGIWSKGALLSGSRTTIGRLQWCSPVHQTPTTSLQTPTRRLRSRHRQLQKRKRTCRHTSARNMNSTTAQT